MNTSSNAIELSGVIRFVENFVLGPLDFRVPTGGVLALVGNNGAGKTTLLDMLMGLGWFHAGAVRVLGHEQPRDAAAVKARAAYVNPDMDYSAWGTVGRALDFLSGFYSDWDEDICNLALASFRLDRKTKLTAHSFGERIKFLLVTAFARDPDLVLLDEPTIGLDVHAQQALCDWIGRLRQRESRTIILSTHQLGFLEQMADHVAVLHEGKLLAMDRIDSLLDHHRWYDLACPDVERFPPSVYVATREGGRARVMIDRRMTSIVDLVALNAAIIAETHVNLQDLVLVLTQGGLRHDRS